MLRLLINRKFKTICLNSIHLIKVFPIKYEFKGGGGGGFFIFYINSFLNTKKGNSGKISIKTLLNVIYKLELNVNVEKIKILLLKVKGI